MALQPIWMSVICFARSVATYKGIDSTAPLISWFWAVMEEFSTAERRWLRHNDHIDPIDHIDRVLQKHNIVGPRCHQWQKYIYTIDEKHIVINPFSMRRLLAFLLLTFWPFNITRMTLMAERSHPLLLWRFCLTSRERESLDPHQNLLNPLASYWFILNILINDHIDHIDHTDHIYRVLHKNNFVIPWFA